MNDTEKVLLQVVFFSQIGHLISSAFMIDNARPH